MAKKDSTVEQLDEKFGLSRELKRPHEGQWALNVAYLRGKQWLAYDGRRIYTPELHEGAMTPVDNRIQGIVRTEIAKMTKTRPVFVSTPRTSASRDIAAASLAEVVGDAKWDELNLTRKLRRALLWSRVCGAGFMKVFWDSSRGDKIRVVVDGDGKTVLDQQERPLRPDLLAELPAEVAANYSVKQMNTGDVAVEIRSPFAMFVDELAGEEGLEEAGWAGEEVVRSPRYVLDRYGKDLAPDASIASGVSEARMPGLFGMADGRKTGVRLRELWARPSSEHPRGKRVVWAGGKILLEDDNPFDWLPYVMFSGILVPGSFWPDCVVTQLISPQTRLNQRQAQIDENASRFGNPPLTYPKGTDVEWYGLPGEHLEFDDNGSPNAQPRFLEVPEVPSYVQQDKNSIEGSFMEISGQHEVTSGKVPAGVTAASAINLLQEQDDTRLGPDVEDMEIALGQLGTRVLELVAKHYTASRTIRIVGDDAAIDIRDFKGSMLNGHTTLAVRAGSGMPRSKAAKQAAMQETLNLLIQYGVQLDQRDLRKFFKEYEVGGLDRLFASISADEQQVNREHARLLAGEEVPVNDFDDHAFHVAGHNEFRKSVRYEQLPSPTRKLVDDHVAEHEAALTPPAVPGRVSAVPGAQAPGTQPPGASAAVDPAAALAALS